MAARASQVTPGAAAAAAGEPTQPPQNLLKAMGFVPPDMTTRQLIPAKVATLDFSYQPLPEGLSVASRTKYVLAMKTLEETLADVCYRFEPAKRAVQNLANEASKLLIEYGKMHSEKHTLGDEKYFKVTRQHPKDSKPFFPQKKAVHDQLSEKRALFDMENEHPGFNLSHFSGNVGSSPYGGPHCQDH